MRALQFDRVPAPLRAHLLGWLGLTLAFFLQSPGAIAADTKLDLVVNPAQFLRGAMSAYTDTFTLGQVQNQAYGYLFPQGLFFLLCDPLPDWISQRLWWILVVGVGYSGMLALLRRADITRSGWFQVLGALVYALSPHTLTTLGAISSETWPSMVAPWIMVPLVGQALEHRRGGLAYSVVAVAMLGAVNATATLAACVPAGLLLLYRRRLRALSAWLVGCALVSAWWIVPLMVLGRYASPFTDYIESAGVTTRWLNLAEILRGTTSWTPFVEAERIAGHQLVSNPYLVVLSIAVAGLGLAGLGSRRARSVSPEVGFFLLLLGVGVLILGGAHLVTGFLDGPGQALRNVHKFDLLVRMPLAVGVCILGSRVAVRKTVAVACTLLSCGAMVPTVNRVVPMGAYERIPGYWYEAASYLRLNAGDTRTLVLPAASFARQDWGWTRDELVQPLAEVPWAVRDSIPLVDPEAIRGLDGLSDHPTAANLARHGIGALLIRHDLAGTDRSTQSILEQIEASDETSGQFSPTVTSFGAVDVVLLAPQRSMQLTATAQVPTVAGGGEILSLLGQGTYRLVSQDADIVTDTPALVARNYGTLGSVSAPLASLDEAPDVLNPVKDYASVGPKSVITGQGSIRASSSQSDAGAFGGADPRRSVTAAVDGDPDTAWYPAPGSQAGQWLELDSGVDGAQGASESTRRLTVTTTGDVVELQVSSGSAHVNLTPSPRTPTTIMVPGDGTQPVRITLGASRYRAGIAEVSLSDGPITRILTVPDSSPNVQQFLFQRITSGESRIDRQFTAPRAMTVTVNPAQCFEDVLIDDTAYRCGDSVDLAAGTHTLHTLSTMVALTVPGFDASGAQTTDVRFDDGRKEFSNSKVDDAVTRTVTIDQPGASDRVLVTARAANSGLKGFLETADGEEISLMSTTVNAGSQGFIIPAGTTGRFRMEFSGNAPYRFGLGLGGGLGIVTVLALLLWGRHRHSTHPVDHSPRDTTSAGYLTWGVMVAATTAAIGWPALMVAAAVWGVLRYTLVSRAHLCVATMAMAAMWLARAPWPQANYAGDSLLLGIACATALLAATAPEVDTAHKKLNK